MALPQGAEILTDPSQISQYRILGQVGKTGTKGSYLYGVRKQPAEERDLPLETPSQQQSSEQPQQPVYNPNQIFQDTVMAMLKAAQGAGDEDLQVKRNAIINARFNAQNQMTPEQEKLLVEVRGIIIEEYENGQRTYTFGFNYK